MQFQAALILQNYYDWFIFDVENLQMCLVTKLTRIVNISYYSIDFMVYLFFWNII